jgi:hypothetical protein
MNRADSKHREHPRLTWFGNGGTVAYVDYTGACTSYFIGAAESGGFKVIPPDGSGQETTYGFATFDAAVDYALTQAGGV